MRFRPRLGCCWRRLRLLVLRFCLAIIFGDAPKKCFGIRRFASLRGVTATERSEFRSYLDRTYDARWSRLALGLLKSRDEPPLKNSKKTTAALTASQKRNECRLASILECSENFSNNEFANEFMHSYECGCPGRAPAFTFRCIRTFFCIRIRECSQKL